MKTRFVSMPVGQRSDPQTGSVVEIRASLIVAAPAGSSAGAASRAGSDGRSRSASSPVGLARARRGAAAAPVAAVETAQ